MKFASNFFLILVILFSVSASAQGRKKTVSSDIFSLDSISHVSDGLFDVYNDKDKWYLVIDDSLFNRDMMAVSRYSSMIAGAPFFAGELANEMMINFYKLSDSKIFLRASGTIITTDEGTPISKSVENSSFQPIIYSFDVVDIINTNRYVIDVTDFLLSDEPFFLKPDLKMVFGISNIDKGRSYVKSVKSYPINVEFKTVKTFNAQSKSRIKAARETGAVSIGFNTSIVLLPKQPMRKRKYDSRVGYFWNTYQHYGESSIKADKVKSIVRWRLEPKSREDEIKQRNGELIEPAKPIVFYIDPATPEKWKKYLKQGVDDWNIAFESAGWKNAIRGDYWPEDDTTMSLEDARFSVIRYFASPYQNAYGPNVNDPRSGEIIESHVGWYHNIMQLLYEWYFIQTSAANPKARSLHYNDSLMGRLIRFVSSHEVGHALGLMHNMMSSSATPVEKLRDKEWIEKYGHTSSIMDYARFNYVAQPQDSIRDFAPRINDYDKWALKWGYSYFGDSLSVEEEQSILNEWVLEAFKDRRLQFTSEAVMIDPRNQMEDLGDDPIKASEYGINNLKIIVDSLFEWTYEPGNDFAELKRLYGAVEKQYNRYLFHVAKIIGGVEVDPLTYEMDGYTYTRVSPSEQKRAVDFFAENLFKAPEWIFRDEILNNISTDKPEDYLRKWQTKVIAALLKESRLERMVPDQSGNYDFHDLFKDLSDVIFSEKRLNDNVGVYERGLQRVFINSIIELNSNDKRKTNLERLNMGAYKNDLLDTDLKTVVRSALRNILEDIDDLPLRRYSELNKNHFLEIKSVIEQELSK